MSLPNFGANDENPFSTANIITNPKPRVGGAMIDATTINTDLLESLHEVEGIEANVATGYYAIAFLLWAQDLLGTDHGAGMRPATDYDTANCTGGNCDHRAQYLMAATDLLFSDLENAVQTGSRTGRAALT